MRGKANGGFGGLAWWVCEAGSVLFHPVEVGTSGPWCLCYGECLGRWETVTSLYAAFYSRMQLVGETLAGYSRALVRLHQRIEGAAPTMAERQALAVLGDGAPKHPFVIGVSDGWVRYDLRRSMLRSADIPFIVVRGSAVSDV